MGGQVLRLLLEDSRVATVFSVSRRPSGISSPKLDERLRNNFIDYSDLWGELTGVDACVFALGVSQTLVRDAGKYREITYDYPLALARALHDANPRARFLFVSGSGADRTGRSAAMFARVKGEAERDLAALLGEQLCVFRPAYIRPVLARETPLMPDTLMRPILWIERFLPNNLRQKYFTDSREVAEAILAVAFGIAGAGVLENPEIKAAAALVR